MNAATSIIDAQRIELAIRQRYSPFPELTMESLTAQLNQFRVGELRGMARTWEIMMERDGELSVPADKLFSDIARLPVEIEKEDDSKEAEQDYEALKYFYNHLTARSVLDGDEVGGTNLLLRQMMTAHAYRYSVHEMVLQISSISKREVTATFNHCPVWFFEARKGRLGYLRGDYDLYGVPLAPGEWLPAVGRGMMRQCSVGYLTKWQPLSYWLLFCYRFGVPGIHGEFNGKEESPEGIAFAEALTKFANDWVTATYGDIGTAKISLIEAAKGGTGTLPFNELVERTDRLYARAFRGGDLSTQSREGTNVSGANPQEGEKRIVLEDGGQWATDILNSRVDEPVIAYLFNRLPKAWAVVRPPKQIDSNRESTTLKAAKELGVPVSVDTARERLDLPKPADGAPLINATPAATPPAPGMPPKPGEVPPALANDAQVAKVTAEILQPILAAYDERLQRILTIVDPAIRKQRWDELKAELASLEQDHLTDPIALVRLLEKITAGAFAAGLEGKTP